MCASSSSAVASAKNDLGFWPLDFTVAGGGFGSPPLLRAPPLFSDFPQGDHEDAISAGLVLKWAFRWQLQRLQLTVLLRVIGGRMNLRGLMAVVDGERRQRGLPRPPVAAGDGDLQWRTFKGMCDSLGFWQPGWVGGCYKWALTGQPVPWDGAVAFLKQDLQWQLEDDEEGEEYSENDDDPDDEADLLGDVDEHELSQDDLSKDDSGDLDDSDGDNNNDRGAQSER
jgi:hypothetical protein